MWYCARARQVNDSVGHGIDRVDDILTLGLDTYDLIRYVYHCIIIIIVTIINR